MLLVLAQTILLFSHERFQKIQEFYGVDLPNLKQSDDDVPIGISVDEISDTLTSYDIHKQILAGDALASIDGFRTMI